MADLVARNRAFLTELFSGGSPGHALWVDPQPVEGSGLPGDVAHSDAPVSAWLDSELRRFEAACASLEALRDDSVPYGRITTGTHLFAAAFGCPVHDFEDSLPAALPLVSTAAEADRLEQPGVYAPPLDRVFEFGALLRERLGPDVPIGVPDIQSPFDIAALIWRKECLYTAIVDEPESVHRLVAKCHALLAEFLREFRREFGEVNYAHCPIAWAPAELGMWLSEDEAGCMSTPMFEEFCLPSLHALSRECGGIFVQCCADADHQHASFRKLEGFRGMNRVFTTGPESSIRDFSPEQVLMVAWADEAAFQRLLDLARPDTRYFFNVPAMATAEETRGLYERLRERCGRS